jgi:predicted dehydrogenase
VNGWILNPKRSGGAAVDLHVHDTDFILQLLGLPQKVTSTASSEASHIFTNYHYDNICVTAEGGWDYPPKWGFQMAFQAVFERGTVEYDSSASPSLSATLGNGPRKALPFQSPSIGVSQTDGGNITSLGGYFNELRYFIDCLEAAKKPEIATLAQAAESLRVVMAEVESAKTGKPVSLR